MRQLASICRFLACYLEKDMRLSLHSLRIVLAGLFLLGLAPVQMAVAGVVTVVPIVTQNGATFHYNYAIGNDTAFDLFLLDIAVNGSIAITNLTAPSGFKTARDTGLGLVSFLEDSQSFGPVPIAGFSYDSLIGPGATTFTGSLLNDNFEIVTMSGPTVGPVGAIVKVPEPGPTPLIGIGVMALLLSRRRLFH